MNNHANWELTQLLPEINPYQQDNGETMYFSWIDFEGKLAIDSHSSIRFYTNGKILRDAWSWESIRLYLESKKISFVVWEYNNKTKYGFITWSKNNLLFPQYSSCNNDDITFDSYEQAREEAIKWCLTKINL